MTDEQIVKALECCVRYENYLACRGCPFSESGVCEEDGLALQKYSLALIKRQQEEIEDLKADKEAIINGQLTLQKMYLESRAEAVREFAEFLIDKAENNVIRIGDLCDYVINFNKMTEEKK